METITTVTERVAAGVDYLDDVMPGWAAKIDLGYFSLNRSCRCVLGQLAHDMERSFDSPHDEDPPDYFDWRYGWLAGVPAISATEAMAFGFAGRTGADDPGSDWQPLADEWRRVIWERQS